jgi:hypothetical protein
VRGADAHQAFESSGFDFLSTPLAMLTRSTWSILGRCATTDHADLHALKSMLDRGWQNVAQMLVPDEVKDTRLSAPTAKRGKFQCQR